MPSDARSTRARRLLPSREVLTFLAVGGAGYVVDVLAFNWLRGQPLTASLDPAISKVLAVCVAMVVTYLGNRMLTWRDRSSDTRREVITFVVLNLIGLGIAVATLVLSHDVLGFTSPLADNISANVIGLGLGTAFRYWSYRRFVFTAAAEPRAIPVPVAPPLLAWDEPQRVHVITGSFGAGHDAAAHEIAERLSTAGHHVRTWDVVDLFPLGLGRLLRSAYFLQLRIAPRSWGAMLRRLEPGTWPHRLAARLLAIPGARILEGVAGADLVISTHPFASQALGRLRATACLSVPAVTYLTDASVHPLWVHPDIWDHRCVLRERPDVLRATVRRTAGILADLSGTPVRWYRPPYGVLSPAALAAARDTGLRTVLWSAWGRDWERRATPSRIVTTVDRTLRPGGTLLLHDTDRTSAPDSWRRTLAASELLLTRWAATGVDVGPLRAHGLDLALVSP